MDAGLISFSLAACVLVSRQIDNVGLLDGRGKMKADKERGEGMQTSGSAE